MRSNARIGPIAIVALGLASCSQLDQKRAQEEAQGRWSEVRGRLKCQLAADTFAAGQLDEAQTHVEEAIGLNPNAPDTYILLAKILLERGETAAAAQALEQGLHCGGDTAETDYLRGVIAERYGQFADALGWYQRASDRQPASAHYVATVAETLVALDRAADALALVKARRTDFEQNATLRALAGGIYVMLGRYEEAANAYREAAQIAPDDETLQFQLGLALTFGQRYEEGQAVLSGAADAEDVPPSVLVALGRCRLALNQYEQAKAALRRAVEASPGHSRAWSWLAQAASASGDLLTARRAASQAAQIEPDNLEHAILLAYVCWRQQDYANAVTLLKRVLNDAPEDMIALYLLSQCYGAVGDGRAAQDCGRRALRVDPRCEWARQMAEEGPVSIRPDRS